MKNECCIVKDVMPLYLENMLSNETGDFVKEHLEKCAECLAEFEELKTENKSEKPDAQQIKNDSVALFSLKKKLRRMVIIAASVLVALALTVIVLIQVFPVYRLARMTPYFNFYSWDELKMIMFVGMPSGRAEVQPVLRLADAAFSDCTHTHSECEELYGELSRYSAPPVEFFSDVNHVDYSLELWSVRLEGNNGYLWVNYTLEAKDKNNNVKRGSRNISSLWKVEKDSSGVWTVTDIKEHP